MSESANRRCADRRDHQPVSPWTNEESLVSITIRDRILSASSEDAVGCAADPGPTPTRLPEEALA